MGGRKGVLPVQPQMASDEDKYKAHNAKLRRQASRHTTQAAVAFSEVDTNNDQKLDFEEFLAMQPKRVRETRHADEIRSAWH